MQRVLLTGLAVLFALLIVGCGSDEATGGNTPGAPIASAPAKGGGGEAVAGEMTPGPGAAEAESRAGSKLGNR